MGTPFFEATAVRPTADGHYGADLADCWNLMPLPQGGIVTAVAVRAMQAALGGDDQRPRTLHTTFAGQVAHGPLDLDVEVLRRGRSMSQVRCEARNPGADRGHLTTCVFGGPREGFDFTELRPPAGVPAPSDCPSFRHPPPGTTLAPHPAPFWTEVVEGRLALGSPPWEDFVPGPAERAVWHRFDDPPLLDDGRLDPLALVVLADLMPGAVAEKVGPADREWFAPSVDLTVHLLGDCWSSWVLAHSRARHAGDGYTSAEIALWDCGDDGTGEPRLVAHGTQLFLFRFLD